VISADEELGVTDVGDCLKSSDGVCEADDDNASVVICDCSVVKTVVKIDRGVESSSDASSTQENRVSLDRSRVNTT
jgi:hypothetical protein